MWASHDADDTCSQKARGVTCQTERREDARGIVQYGIDTGPLLEEHRPFEMRSYSDPEIHATYIDPTATL